MQVTKLNITVPFEDRAWDDLENQIIKQNQDFSWTAGKTYKIFNNGLHLLRIAHVNETPDENNCGVIVPIFGSYTFTKGEADDSVYVRGVGGETSICVEEC